MADSGPWRCGAGAGHLWCGGRGGVGCCVLESAMNLVELLIVAFVVIILLQVIL